MGHHIPPEALQAAFADVDPEMTVGEALKAVTAGGPAGINQQGQVPQDLEVEARNQLFGEEDFVGLRRIPSIPAKSLKHEFQRVVSYGDLHGALYQDEGGAGTQTALGTEPVQVTVKTVSHVNKITGEAAEQETVDILGSRNPKESNRTASMRILHFKISMHAWFGDSRGTTSDRAWEGFIQQHRQVHADAAVHPNNPFNMPPEYLIDMGGKPLNRETVRHMGRIIYEEGWGRLTDGLMTPLASDQFQGDVETNLKPERTDIDATRLADGGVIIGTPVRGVRHQGGDCLFYPDNTISPRYFHADPSVNPKWNPEPGAPVRPAAPQIAVQDNNGGGYPQSRWKNADLPGAAYTLTYKIQAENKKGYSQSSPASASVVAVAGGRNVVTFNSSADALGYRILRNSPEEPTKWYEVGRVKNDAAVLTFTDYNWILPGFHRAFFTEMRYPGQKRVRLPKNAQDNAICFADLNGKGVRAKRLWETGDFEAELIYVRRTPQLNQPRRLIEVINIGNRS